MNEFLRLFARGSSRLVKAPRLLRSTLPNKLRGRGKLKARSVHHANLITLANTNAIKIIENHLGSAFVKNGPTQLLKLG